MKKMPGYLSLLKNNRLEQRTEQLLDLLSPCRLCPWKCGVDRIRGERGRCRALHSVRAAKATAHFGEEPVISGAKGSGTIFFSHCNLNCCFCQNFQISQEALGRDLSVEELSSMMLHLQEQGCHNINLVSPSHYIPFIIQALSRAAKHGLLLPIVYNSNGYEDVEMLRLLDGIVDIYLPDAKYADDQQALKYSGAQNYTEINLKALDEMFRQAGYLEVDSSGIAVRGMIIRHLVLPRGLSGTKQVLKTVRARYGKFIAVSLMGQYTPCFKAPLFPELIEKTAPEDYQQAVAVFESLGFEQGWVQELENLDASFVPDFRKKDSWN